MHYIDILTIDYWLHKYMKIVGIYSMSIIIIKWRENREQSHNH